MNRKWRAVFSGAFQLCYWRSWRGPIEGAGSDIWGAADSFHFVYRQTVPKRLNGHGLRVNRWHDVDSGRHRTRHATERRAGRRPRDEPRHDPAQYGRRRQRDGGERRAVISARTRVPVRRLAASAARPLRFRGGSIGERAVSGGERSSGVEEQHNVRGAKRRCAVAAATRSACGGSHIEGTGTASVHR